MASKIGENKVKMILEDKIEEVTTTEEVETIDLTTEMIEMILVEGIILQKEITTTKTEIIQKEETLIKDYKDHLITTTIITTATKTPRITKVPLDILQILDQDPNK